MVSRVAHENRLPSDQHAAVEHAARFISYAHLRVVVVRGYPKFALLLAVLVLIVARAPFLLTHPRIWAEEGAYLNFAMHHSVLQALFHLHLDSGYYVLSANFPAIMSAFASKRFGLIYAPVVTTYFSFCLQMLPFAILSYGNSHLFRDWLSKLTACVLILLAPTTSGEIWLNTINSISWTGLTAVIILFEDSSSYSAKRRIAFRFILALCGLCGPYAAITFPLFLFAHFVYREREKLIQAFVLLLSCAFQAGIFVYARHFGGAASRLSRFTVDSGIVNAFFFHVVGAFGGERGAAVLFDHIGMADSLRKSLAVPRGGPVLLAACFCALVIVLSLFCLWDGKMRSQNTLLIGTFLMFTAVTAVASARGIPHHRYAFLPGVSLLFLVWTSATQHRYRLVRLICWILLACSIWSGGRDYRVFWREYRAYCSPWSEEVQKWRADHRYQLHVWPEGFHAFVEWNPKPRSTNHK